MNYNYLDLKGIKTRDVFEINRQDYEHRKLAAGAPRVFKAILDKQLTLVHINRPEFKRCEGQPVYKCYDTETADKIVQAANEAMARPGKAIERRYSVSLPIGLAHVHDEYLYIGEMLIITGIVERVT